MLIGISPLLSSDLLKTLHEMGHGDEILLADAHFPAYSLGQRVLRSDGLSVAPLLHSILPLLALDTPGNPLAMMLPEDPADLDRSLEASYMAPITRYAGITTSPARLARAGFYERSRAAFVVLLTGEIRPYGNILLRKGVTPLSAL